MPEEDTALESTPDARERMRSLMTEFNLRMTPWSTAAGLSSNTVSAFLKGSTKSMKQSTLEALAKAGRFPVVRFYPTIEGPTKSGPPVYKEVTLTDLDRRLTVMEARWSEQMAAAEKRHAEQMGALTSVIDALTQRRAG